MMVLPDRGSTGYLPNLTSWDIMPVIIILAGIIIAGIMIYLLTAVLYSQERRPEMPNRSYYFFICYLSLLLFYVASADILRLINGVSYLGYSSYANSPALILLWFILILFLLPIFAFHYFGANPKKPEARDEIGSRIYTNSVLTTATILVMISGLINLFSIPAGLLGLGTGTPIPVWSYLLLALILWVRYFWLYKKQSRD